MICLIASDPREDMFGITQYRKVKSFRYPDDLAVTDATERVTATNNADYRSEKSFDGGSYAFYTRYDRVGVKHWRKTFATSAGFDYCKCCGQFGHVSWECSKQWPDVVSTTEMLAEIRELAGREKPTQEVENKVLLVEREA